MDAMASEVSTAGAQQDLHRSVAELELELGEAHRREAATAEVLEVISRSTFNLQAVLDGLIESAVRLTGAEMGLLYRQHGDFYRATAIYGASPELIEVVKRNPISPDCASATGRAVLERRVIHIEDVVADPEYTWTGREGAGIRTILAVPMLRDGAVIGVIVTRRTRVQPFTDKQIELLTTFANQAVIAIENTRLFGEVQAKTRDLQESLEYQTATSRVLEVISSSPGNLEPVFETILSNARRLCGAKFGHLFLYHDGYFHAVALHDAPPEYARFLTREPIRPGPETGLGRIASTRQIVHILDISAEPAYRAGDPLRRASVDLGGVRTFLGMPMVRGNALIGALVVYRDEVRSFTDAQVELVAGFADQAVIAIENARLLHALRESLQQQTATADVLKVISRSTFNLQAVLNTLVEAAAQLCEADMAQISHPTKEAGHYVAASYGFSPEYIQLSKALTIAPGRGSLTGRVLLEGRPVQIPDVLADPEYSNPEPQRLGGYRTHLGVPLLRDGSPIGVILVSRRTVRPFDNKQIELITTFADQAVIAIENTRLFEEVQARTSELTESLEYQTATSEVLNVISRSPTDVQPVFDMIAQSAWRLCEAQYCFVYRFDGQLLHFVAHHGPTRDVVEMNRRAYPSPPSRRSAAARAVLERSIAQIPDVNADPEFGHGALAAAGGYRSAIGVPILRDGIPIGSIALTRAQVGLLPDRQIELLKIFADQAVIAIENTRLFEEVQARTSELTESLEFQTATSEVLNVISRSPAQLEPVLNTIVETASRLCKADHAHVFRLQDGKYHLVAHNQTQHHIIEYLSKNPIGLDQLGSVTARAARACKTVHVPDAMQDPEYGHGPLTFSNDRTVLSVPLLREGITLGVVTVGRQTLRPFTGNEIELVESFADQAVIAIENTRLFEEVQARTRALQESLEYQTAMSDVLGVISSSPNKLQPVLDAIVNTAKRLCIADRAYFNVLVEGRYHSVAATEGIPKHIIDDVRAKPEVAGRGSHAARAVLEKRPIHIKDTRLDPEFTLYDVNEPGRARTLLGVPLLRRDEVIGVITLARIDPAPFTQRQIDLVATFANQAVIAINNVDLFEEVQARNRDLTALGEVGLAVSSTLELRTVLKTIVDRAIELSSTDAGSIFYFRNDRFELGETTGLDEEAVARFRRLDISVGQTGLGEAIASRSPLQIADITRRPSNPLRDAAIEAGLRAALIVPLLSGDGPLGALVLQRRTPGEFSAAVVTLMQSFADQSAIALENARLFEEIAHKSRELEIASQHKSQFVANMSHELRTPLAAILGFAELIQEGFYGPLPDKSMDALTRIRSNGKHLLD